MPDIRGIFLYRGENLVYSQIFPIIEKELKKKLGPKYEELPDEYLLHAYIMKRQGIFERTSLCPKESIDLTLIESNQHDESLDFEGGANGRNSSELNYPLEQKLYLFKDLFLNVGKRKFLALTFQRSNFYLIVFPRDECAQDQTQAEYESLLKNSNFYAAVQFGEKLMTLIMESLVGKSNLEEILDLILLNCVPFGRILSDNFSAFMSFFSENKSTVTPFEQGNKMPSHQNKLIIQDPIKKISFLLEEKIVTYQFNREDVKDFQLIEGKLRCKLDNASDEEISLMLSHLTEDIIKNLVLNTDGSLEKAILPNQVNTKITFTIPNEKDFNVCQYFTSNVITLPITGSYSRKQLSETQYKIKITLNVLPKFKQFLKDLKLQLRLDPSASIICNDLTVNQGKIEIIQSKVLLWSLNNTQDIKQEISITGTFTIERTEGYNGQEKMPMNEYIRLLQSNNGLHLSRLEENDILFFMPDKFVEIEFELVDSIINTVEINQGQIVIFPTRKLDLKIQKSAYTQKYFIFLNEDLDVNDFTYSINNQK